MTKRKIEAVKHLCGDCGHGKYYYEHQNIDIYGKPICVRCPYSEYARLRNEPSCEHWKPKNE